MISDKGPIFEVERNEPWSCYTRSGRHLPYGIEAVCVPVTKRNCLRTESNFISCDNREWHIAVSTATLYELDGSEFDPPVRTKFIFTPVQIGPGGHLAPVLSVTGLFPRGQETGA